MSLYDPKKHSEYKFRAIVSAVLFFVIVVALWAKGAKGPAAWELIFFGLTFCAGSFVHALWALGKINSAQHAPK